MINTVSFTILITAHKNRAELQHTINSVLRSLMCGAISDHKSIIIYDEYGEYGSTYDTGSMKLKVVPVIDDQSLHGDWIFIVPALTLVSKNWITNALHELKSNKHAGLLRPELNIQWGEELQPRVIRQPKAQDILYNIDTIQYSAAVCVKRSELAQHLQDIPQDISVSHWLEFGFGWLPMVSAIIPDTAVFTRSEGSLFSTREFTSPLLNFSASKNSQISFPVLVLPERGKFNLRVPPGIKSGLWRTAKGALRRANLLGTGIKLHNHFKSSNNLTHHSALPSWLQQEWRLLHRIDNRLFPSEYLVSHASIEDMPTYDTQKLAYVYKQITLGFNHNHYDYVFFAPWLVRGGADKFTIEYANTIAAQRPDLNILVITTLDRESEWQSKLTDVVDYCNFGTITTQLSESQKQTLLQRIIAQGNTRVLHIINSEFAYNFTESHGDWLHNHGIQIVATSFSQEVDGRGKVLGYSHTHVPEIYESLTLLTSDNNAVLKMWQEEYGFDKNRLVIHHLPYKNGLQQPKESSESHLKVLWASRLSPEKAPHLVGQIGSRLEGQGISIDMFGTAAPNFDVSFLNQLPKNVRYKGSFDGMETLPVHEYDAFLYTSVFDGMPNTLLEIGSTGTPIVSSSVGGIPELIINGETGLLADNFMDPDCYAKLLRKLKDDAKLGITLGANLRNKISRDYSEDQFKSSVKNMLTMLGV